MTILSYIVVTLLTAFGIAAFMEFYKKVVRKGGAKTWEIILIAILVSFAGAAAIVYTGLAYSIPNINPALSMCIYAVIFFVIQYFLDMNVIKAIVKRALDTMDVEVFIGCVLKQLNITVDQAKELLKKAGVTKEKFIEFLLKVGFTDKQAQEAAAIFYE